MVVTEPTVFTERRHNGAVFASAANSRAATVKRSPGRIRPKLGTLPCAKDALHTRTIGSTVHHVFILLMPANAATQRP